MLTEGKSRQYLKIRFVSVIPYFFTCNFDISLLYVVSLACKLSLLFVSLFFLYLGKYIINHLFSSVWSGTNKKPSSPKKKQKDFIMRNIYLAKEGVFANSSLTDEEKAKLEDILQYEDEDTQERQQRSPFTLPSTESGRSSYFSNAYCFTFDDKKKIEDIDSQLEKFKLDEKSSEKNLNSKEDSNDGDASKTIDEVRKMNHVMLEKNLKKLEDRLRELQDAENKDLETLRKIREETKINIEGNEDDVDDMPPMGDLFDLDVLNIGENELEYIDMEGLKGEDIDYEETGEEEDEDKEETNVFDEVEEGSTIDFQSK